MTHPVADTQNALTIAFIGFGEAAGAFVSGWDGAAPATIRAYDIKTDQDGTARQRQHEEYAAARVAGCETAEGAAAGTDVIFSMVTADQALAAAGSVAGAVRRGALYFDCNSCAPDTKREAARVIDGAGARYMDVAVMAPVHPRKHRTPLLVSGPAAQETLDIMRRLDMSAREAPGGVGAASAIKLVRSIMVKGLEALTAECLLAGHKLDVTDAVLDSLEETFPGFGWKERAGRSLERMMVHGQRRAAEMRETTAMVEALGLPGRMTRATATWQQQIGELALSAPQSGYQKNSDRILRALMTEREGR